MPITINGEPLADGDPLLVNGEQADEVRVNGVLAWRNQVPPSLITDLVASDDQLGQVTITFTPATGIPTPVHRLLENGVFIAEISPGYVRTVAPGNRNYQVEAVNAAGTVTSNLDTGRSLAPGGSQTFTVNGNFTVPAGIYVVHVCMVGGGGSGATTDDRSAGGGFAGATVAQNVNVTPGQVLPVVVGGGGQGTNCPGAYCPGIAGTASTFAGLTAAGGAGGTLGGNPGGNPADVGYAGNGGVQTTCAGSSVDGLQSWGGGRYMGGGQGSGFGNGGQGGLGSGVGGDGAVGAGGGGTSKHVVPPKTNGGRGEVRITWNPQ
jgi:hypothetical protein